MAAGEGFANGFCHVLATELRTRFAADFANLLVCVPTARVAARLRTVLSEEFTGVLPAILPLKGTPELAELLGIDMPAAADTLLAKLELARFLKQPARAEPVDLFEAAEDALTPPEDLRGERLWRRVDELYTTLDRLALHGVSVQDLRRGVPSHMVGLWEQQADILLRAARHMERWLHQRRETWPGAAERRILEQTAHILAQPNSPWVPVVAGVCDGVPAALEVMRTAATRGGVWVPSMGPATEELVTALDMPVTPLSLGVNALEETVAATDWDETWVAALAVRRAIANGDGRIAVVSPSRSLLARVQGILQGWDLQVPVGGQLCLGDTSLARQVLSQPHWGTRGRKLAQWRELATTHGFDYPHWPRVLQEFARLENTDAWLEADDWQAVLRLVMADIPIEQPASEGVFLLGPLDARLLDFDTVIAAGCVEGVWPAQRFDAWMSEPHLRALNLPDTAHKALLMGTELESILHSGSGRVVVIRTETTDGKDAVRSRFLAGYTMTEETELVAVAQALRNGTEGTQDHIEQLGCFVPQGDMWPRRWSASFMEAMLACPYRALGERVLKLEKPDPLTPLPDARTAGLLVHRWLENVAKLTIPPSDTDALVTAMTELAEAELAHEAPVVRAIWRGKFARLAPALAAQWQADGRSLDAAEHKLTRDMGKAAITATLDRVEKSAHGKVIIDFKTGTPPAWSRVAAGIKPQLALEAWLMGPDVAGVEYWHLKGYGTAPLNITRAGAGAKQALEPLMEPVEKGVTQLMETYAEGTTFAAVPDRQGGGLQATGHCEYCDLAGVCRRKGVVAHA